MAVMAIMLGCSSSFAQDQQTKKEEREQKRTDKKQHVDKANVEYQADIDNYRKETDAKASANDKIIADLKARIDIQKKETQEDYKKKISELEQKNAEMKKKMDE